MRMQAGPEDIFGDTSEGVPNPLVPHVHPYPTRYHGPIWTQPQAMKPFLPTPYARAPYAGTGQSDAPVLTPAIGLVSAASAALSAYHGYRRHESVGWAVWWGVMGGLFPVITPAIAWAQGFGHHEKRAAMFRRRRFR